MKTMLKALLWDVDGTLIDFPSSERYALRKCFELFGLGECTDEMLSVYSGINRRYWSYLEQGKMRKKQILVSRFEEFFSLYGLPANISSEFNDEFQVRLSEHIEYIDGALETLEALNGKILQFAVTNGTKADQELKLIRSGLNRFFETVFNSEVIGYDKPDRRFFDIVFKQTGLTEPGSTMIIGDSLSSDIRGGIDYGLITCWYDPDLNDIPEGLAMDYHVRSLRQIPSIVESII